MELEKKDTCMVHGVAIWAMILLHLYLRKGAEVSGSPLIWINQDVPLIYYLAFLSEICVPLYCFCTGYALFLQFSNMELKEYLKKTYFRLFKFLIHFWVVCIIFTIVGILFDQYGEIPVNIYRFLGNFFLLEHTYNGAWWFASTYILFVLISPLFLKLAKKADSRVLFIVFAMIFCVYYLCKVLGIFATSPEEYYWKGFLVRKLSDLWYVSFFYIVGMLLAKEKIISKTRKWWNRVTGEKSNFYLFIVVSAAILAMCVIEVSGMVYFFSIFCFICFNLWKKPDYVERFFLFFGEHSTNIWLVHMFFYLFIFKELVFIVKYPVFVIPFMFVLTIVCSYIINFILKLLWKSPLFRKLTACVEN